MAEKVDWQCLPNRLPFHPLTLAFSILTSLPPLGRVYLARIHLNNEDFKEEKQIHRWCEKKRLIFEFLADGHALVDNGDDLQCASVSHPGFLYVMISSHAL